MADKDEEFLDGDEASGGDSKESGKPKKGPFASAMLMQILKWAAIVVGLIILMVTVAFVVVQVTGANNSSNAALSESPEYHTKPVNREWYSAIAEFQGETADKTEHHRYKIKLALGFEKGDKEINNQLVDREIQIKDMLLTWFSRQNAEKLKDIELRNSIKEEIKAEINRLIEGQIQEVAFETYDIISLD